jgi:hypothetical protein
MNEQAVLAHLMQHDERARTPLSNELLQVTLEELTLLSRHFRRDLDEMETHTYVQGLRGVPPLKLKKAIRRALETMKRMPMIANLCELVRDASRS